MIMVADVAPSLKRFLQPLALRQPVCQSLVRLIVAFLLHFGRMSCSRAAGALRTDTRHRAQICRFLGRPRWRALRINDMLRRQLLAAETKRGRFLLILDSTLCSQQGKKTENTYCTGNRKRRPRKGRRYGKYKHASRSCHSFLFGLLITPSGIRVPYCCPHLTEQYCRQNQRVYRTPAQAAADLIRELELPPGAHVVVLGDTAFEADVVRDACAARGFLWIVPCNPERVLAGPKPRPKVRSLLKDLSHVSLKPVRLEPGRGQYVAYRRLSPHRVGPKAKPRTYYVHEERRNVQSVGDVRLVFSTRKSQLKLATSDDVKILMTNAMAMAVREVVELYSLRWQIELFFKELKSTLGFHQYRLRKFTQVEGWVEAVLATFLYLEWYRAQQLRRRNLREKEKKWWESQRTYGLCLAVRQASEAGELKYLADRLETDGGITKLKRLLAKAFPKEYRATA